MNPSDPQPVGQQPPTYYQLTNDDLIITERSPRKKYRRRTNDEKKGIHWGQRKLMMSEIEFINLFCDFTQIPNPKFVYAGAAPGKHIRLLSQMFPWITFYLYDPAAFAKDLHDGVKIFTYQQLFTDEDAQRWANRNDVFFISDIRTADYTKMGEAENEQAIDADMQMQRRWLEIINPVQAMLKFRLPYPDRWPSNTYEYLFGFVMKQIWAPQTSTETRLIPIRSEPTTQEGTKNKGRWQTTQWDILAYEERLFYHNTVVREEILFADPVNFETAPLDPPELINDFDSMAEALTLRDYLYKVGDPRTQIEDPQQREQAIKKGIVELSRLLTQSINAGKRKEHWVTLNGLRTGPIKSTSVNARRKIQQLK